jgi:hypothetical protein
VWHVAAHSGSSRRAGVVKPVARCCHRSGTGVGQHRRCRCRCPNRLRRTWATHCRRAFTRSSPEFVSGLADHALLIIAIAGLSVAGWPGWAAPLLMFSFTLAHVLGVPWAVRWRCR